jgi:hypothetical protein
MDDLNSKFENFSENLTLGVQPRFDRVMQILDLFTDNSTVGSPAFNALNGGIVRFMRR